jgi:hypothetical protein
VTFWISRGFSFPHCFLMFLQFLLFFLINYVINSILNIILFFPVKDIRRQLWIYYFARQIISNGFKQDFMTFFSSHDCIYCKLWSFRFGEFHICCRFKQ